LPSGRSEKATDYDSDLVSTENDVGNLIPVDGFGPAKVLSIGSDLMWLGLLTRSLDCLWMTPYS